MSLKKDAMGCIQQKHRIKEARLILHSGIYIFCYQYFARHGLPSSGSYIFRTVKSVMLLLFDISTYS